MLTKIFLDNYRCFVNFEVGLSRCTLLLGPNGVGKSALFELLDQVRRFVGGEFTATEAFPSQTLTRWQTSTKQTIHLGVEGGQGNDVHSYEYVLEVEHEPARQRCRVMLELVRTQSQVLFKFAGGDVQLYRDDGSSGPSFPFDWNRSGLTTVVERHDNKRLSWFKRWLQAVICARLNPSAMLSRSEREITHPRTDLADFSSWFRHLLQEHPAQTSDLFQALAGVLDGFESLELAQDGETARTVRARFTAPSSGGSYPLSLAELSDGQRALVVYYSMLHLLTSVPTVCLDEPDNFLALQEIQPLLFAFCDRAQEDGPQLLVTSHHPETIDHAAFQKKLVFSRANGGPTRVKTASEIDAKGLTLSEYFARGWHND